MSEFRWLLLGLAVAVFIGTVIWSQFTKNNRARDLFDASADNDFEKDILFADQPLEIEEDFGVSEVRIIKPDERTNLNTDALTSTGENFHATQDTNSRFDDKGQENSEDAQHIVVLHVTAHQGETFKGKKVCKTLEHLGLRHGKYMIYHRESLQNPEISLFSVVNMVKPGFFDKDVMETFTTPGISFFLVLPGPPDPVTTFNEMVQTARQVAQTLGGELLDSERSTFSGQRAQLIQDEIVNFMHRFNEE
jgi:cell division protein ZipA